jgi:hypothetical protein
MSSSNLESNIEDMQEGLRIAILDARDEVIHDLALQQPEAHPLTEPQEGHEAVPGEDPEENLQLPDNHPQGLPLGPPPPQNYPSSPSLGNSQENLPGKPTLDYLLSQPSSYNLQPENPVIAHPDPAQGVVHLVSQSEALSETLSDLDGMRGNLEVGLRQFLEREMIRPSLFPNILMLIAFFLLAQHWL